MVVALWLAGIVINLLTGHAPNFYEVNGSFPCRCMADRSFVQVQFPAWLDPAVCESDLVVDSFPSILIGEESRELEVGGRSQVPSVESHSVHAKSKRLGFDVLDSLPAIEANMKAERTPMFDD